ncbi:MAG: hypothetical protein AAB512_00680 [Patescibacteria group bacterium]
MVKEDGRSFGIKPALEFVRSRLGKANPVAASVEGPELTEEEQRELCLSGIPGTAAHARAAQKLVDSFDQVELHRKRRKKGGK